MRNKGGNEGKGEIGCDHIKNKKETEALDPVLWHVQAGVLQKVRVQTRGASFLTVLEAVESETKIAEGLASAEPGTDLWCPDSPYVEELRHQLRFLSLRPSPYFGHCVLVP